MPHLNSNGYWEKTPLFAHNDSGIRYRDDYWRTEAERWVNGYSFGQYGYLSGLHYFHLTMGSLISGEYGKIIPDWRDADGGFFDAYLESVAETKNLYEIKWRGFGFSSDCAAVVAWNSIIYEGSEIQITSVDNGRLIRMRNKIVLPYLQGINKENIIKPVKQTKDLDFIPVQTIDSDNPVSAIYFQETSSDKEAVQKLESYRSRLIVLDELFLHKHYEDVLLSAEGSTTERGKKFGTIIAGGNCNDVNKDSAKRVTDLCSSAQSRGFKVHVTPGYMGRAEFMMPDPQLPMKHISDVFRAKEYIQKKLEGYREQGDWDKYLNFKKENLFSMSDLLVSTSASEVSDDLQDKIAIGRQRAEQLNIIPCRLKFNPEGIFTDLDENGKIYIATRPESGHVYIAGCDPIPGTGQGKRGSDFVCVIKDITTGKYVAYYAERSNDQQDMYAKFKTLLAWYKSNLFPQGAPCMIERNAMAFVWAIAQERGEMYLLAADPKSKDGSVKGYHKAPNTNIDATLNALVLNHINRYDVPFSRFYEELDKLYENANLDFMDAFKSCEFYFSHLAKITDDKTKENKLYRTVEMDSHGVLTTTWKPKQ